MSAPEPSHPEDSRAALRARFRMGCLLLLLLVIHFLEAWITFPFVDHTTNVQNISYGLVVTAPFTLAVICYLVLTRRDLGKLDSL